MNTEVIKQHIERFFEGHAVHETQWTGGPAKEALPELRILHVSPGPKTQWWTFLTVGASAANPANPFEYLIVGDEPRNAYAELLTILAYYGIVHNLGFGHTVSIGRALAEGSRCEYLYLSLPYTFGPELEICRVGEEEVHFLWAFPITHSEQQHLLEKGVESLERRFEKHGVKYWSLLRKSVV